MINDNNENISSENLDDAKQENEENVTDLDRQLLDNAGADFQDKENLQRSLLDDTDEDGTPLNEESGTSAIGGGDLDVPGSDLDDADEKIGEEDEENNSYSEADTK